MSKHFSTGDSYKFITPLLFFLQMARGKASPVEGSREIALAGGTLVFYCLFLGGWGGGGGRWGRRSSSGDTLECSPPGGMSSSALQRLVASSLTQPAPQCVLHIPSWCLRAASTHLLSPPACGTWMNFSANQQTTRHSLPQEIWTQPQGQERAPLGWGDGSEVRGTWCPCGGHKLCSQHPHQSPHN